LSKDATQKIFKYIALLENTNEKLVSTLRYCVELLTQFKPSAPDPDGWQKMLNSFQEVITVTEKTVEKRQFID